jgi:hypothetical protein
MTWTEALLADEVINLPCRAAMDLWIAGRKKLVIEKRIE